MNPLQKAIQSGIKANDMVGDLFAKIGTKDHPRGFAKSAYRNALRSMKTALGEQNSQYAANDVMLNLRRSLESETRALFIIAQESGVEESRKQMSFYGVKSPDGFNSMQLSKQNQSALDAVLAKLDAQNAAINAALLTGQNPSAILGDDERDGILRDSEILAALSFWGTALLWDAFEWWTDMYSGGIKFQKQAIAALDARTTDCCLRVHGQVQNMNSPFHLTGTPRYADYIDWPGFHWYCRTSGVLYLPGFDDGLTERMRASAEWFINERRKGKNPDNDPANAF